ncbi:MAG: hypothetical protein JSS30_06275 [Verrucomicrobia bacterium]|nr:hypothetical protein [Verrucomicrobiota bacterium]
MFLNALNDAKPADIPAFGIHTPNPPLKPDSYGYCYVETENKARTIAAWLLRNRINSEILYVEAKEKFIVKIPFITLIPHDHFASVELTKEVVEIQNELAKTVEVVDPLWTAPCSQIATSIGKLYTYLLDRSKIQRVDIVQTTFFTLGQDCSMDPITTELSKTSIDFKEIELTIRNYCNCIQTIDSALQQIKNMTLSQCKSDQLSVKETEQVLHRFLTKKREMILQFCDLSSSDILTKIEMIRLDNLIYQLWLILNQQLRTLEDKPEHKELYDGCFRLKNKVIELSQISVKKITQTPFSFFRDSTSHFFTEFLKFHTPQLYLAQKEIFDEGKRAAEQIVETNKTDIKNIADNYILLKTDANQLMREIFFATNPGKPKPKA